ncbi:MAG: response regulator [Bdellovibrionota bacterium]
MKFRFMVMTSFLVLICSFTGSMLVSYKAEQRELADTIESFKSELNAISNKALASIENLKGDAILLSKALPIDEMINSGRSPQIYYQDKNWRMRLSHLMASLAEIRPRYQQIRYLSDYDAGQEILRIDKINGILSEATALQEKGGRDYYVETRKLDAGQVYISPINLNREFGEISKPITKTIRIGIPVKRGKEFLGMFVINQDMGPVFDSLWDGLPKNNEFFIVNRLGYYLLHKNRSKEFSWEYGGQENLQVDYPELTDFLNDSKSTSVTEIIKTEKQTYLVHAVKVAINGNDGTDNFIVPVMLIPYEVIEQGAAQIRQYSMLIGVFFVLLGTFISWVFSSKLTTPLIALAANLQKFSKGEKDIYLAKYKDEEINDVINAFNSMAKERTLQERKIIEASEMLEWLRDGALKLNERIRDKRDVTALGQAILDHIDDLFNLYSGMIYCKDGGVFNVVASYSQISAVKSSDFRSDTSLSDTVKKVIEDRKIHVVKDSQYINSNSNQSDSSISEKVIAPCFFNDDCIAVVEVTLLKSFNEKLIRFFDENSEAIAIAFNLAIWDLRLENLLEETQKQSEKLKAQQEELRQSNEELAVQNNAIETQKKIVDEKNNDLEKIKRKLEHSTQELLKANNYKSQFLANMSHELRTPLNSLLILSSLLEKNDENNLTKDQVASLISIRESGEDLLSLIDDVLDLSKVESGYIKIQKETINVRDFISNFAVHMRPIAEEKNIGFEVSVHLDVPEMMATDARRLEQVLKNLASNAIRFTEEGRVEIKVDFVNSLKEETDFDHCIRFMVTDTGIGIDKKDYEHIFEAFHQVDQGISKSYGGTGLGLSIARELIHLLGGKIVLNSVVGKGSSFTITLPWKPNELDEKSEIQNILLEGTSSVGEQFEKPTNNSADLLTSVKDKGTNSEVEIDDGILKDKAILLVDDDMRNIFAVSSVLEKYEINVRVAKNGQDAIEKLNSEMPNLVLMDIMMPVMDGIEAIKKIRNELGFVELPVIALTAKAAKEDKTKCIDAGYSDYLSKPVDIDKLIKLIKKWI